MEINPEKKRTKTGGRKKGTPNKTTVELKAAVMHAFETVGGESYLVHVAETDPRTFCSLLARVLPAELKTSIDVIDKAEALAQARKRALEA